MAVWLQSLQNDTTVTRELGDKLVKILGIKKIQKRKLKINNKKSVECTHLRVSHLKGEYLFCPLVLKKI